MVALEPTLRSAPTSQSILPYEPLPPVFRVIEYNLPRNYRRYRDTQHGYHWIYRVEKSNLSAHIYPNVDHHIINIAIYDDRNPDESKLIRKWSGDLKMTGKKWRRRLRQTAGEATVLAHQRPACPNCRKPLILRERRSDQQQFFGCEDYPGCNGSISIIDHDLDRKKAVSYSSPVDQNSPTRVSAV